VPLRIHFEPLLALDGMIDFLRRDYPFFHKAVRDHCRDPPMEEVQNPAMHCL